MTLKVPTVRMSTHDLANLVCEHLPTGYEIKILLENGSGLVELHDTSGFREFTDDGVIEMCDDDLTIDEQVTQRLNKARELAGLPPVEIPVVMVPVAG